MGKLVLAGFELDAWTLWPLLGSSAHDQETKPLLFFIQSATFYATLHWHFCGGVSGLLSPELQRIESQMLLRILLLLLLLNIWTNVMYL